MSNLPQFNQFSERIDNEIIIEMIRTYFRTKHFDGGNHYDFSKYPMMVDSLQEYNNGEKMQVWYKIKWGGKTDEDWSLQVIGLNMSDYRWRLNYKTKTERDRKLEEVLKKSFWEKLWSK